MQGSQKSRPLLSVIVPVYGVEQYIRRCLNSIIGQTYRNIEVIVVDDGSPDKSAEIARTYAKWDRRVKVVSKPNGGLGAARNTGLEYATGEFVTFVDSDDRLVKDAYSAMVGSLLATGSDFVVAGAYRERAGKTWLSRWTRDLHTKDRLGIKIDDFPEIFEDAVAWNKVWRTSFFRDYVGGFPEKIKYEDQEPAVLSYLNAQKFDVLRKPVYYWLIREDGTSISQGKERLDDLRDRLSVLKSSAKHIVKYPNEAVQRAWFAKVVAGDLIQYLEVAPRTGHEYWQVLRSGIDSLTKLTGQELWGDLPFWTRVPAWLAVNTGKESTAEFLNWRAEHGEGLRLTTEGDRIFVDADNFGGSFGELPAYIREVPLDFLEPKSRVTAIEWLDGATVRISGYSFCPHLLDGNVIAPTLVLRCPDTGNVTHLDARWSAPSRLGRFRSANVDPSNSEFQIDIDTGSLDRSHAWALAAILDVGSEELSFSVGQPEATAGAADLGFAEVSGSNRWVLTDDPHFGLLFENEATEVSGTLEQSSDRDFILTVSGPAASTADTLIITNARASKRLSVRGNLEADGSVQFAFSLPELAQRVQNINSNAVWHLQLEDQRRKFSIPPTDGFAALRDLRNAGALRIEMTKKRNLSIVENSWRAQIDSFHLSAVGGFTQLKLAGRVSLPIGFEFDSIKLVDRAMNMWPVQSELEPATGRFTAAVRLSQENWHGAHVPLSPGGYHLKLIAKDRKTGAERRKWLELTERAAIGLPVEYDSAIPFVVATRTKKTRALWLTVSAPVPFADRGVFNREQAIAKSIRANAETGLRNSVIFESFHGKRAGDNPEPLVRELKKLLPDWKFYWSTSHLQFDVPEGTTPLVRGSREYIDAIFRSRLLVNNGNFPFYFRKQPGQVYLQTWHGTPLKMIGNDVHSEGLSTSYRQLMKREVRYWDVLLAQSEFAAEKFASAFSSTAKTVIDGYPRNDCLVDGPESRKLRAATREVLGVSDEECLILYAPTFRDSQRAQSGGYTLDTGIDLDAVLNGLPANTTIALRAHSNISANSLEYSESILDVTDYPNAQDLLAAADLLITDYSSIMFDFAVTGRPMVFHAPDLDEYLASSRKMYLDYERTVPGPITRTTGELVREVSAMLTKGLGKWADDYDDFVKTFAPYDDGKAAARVARDFVKFAEDRTE